MLTQLFFWVSAHNLVGYEFGWRFSIENLAMLGRARNSQIGFAGKRGGRSSLPQHRLDQGFQTHHLPHRREAGE